LNSSIAWKAFFGLKNIGNSKKKIENSIKTGDERRFFSEEYGFYASLIF